MDNAYCKISSDNEYVEIYFHEVPSYQTRQYLKHNGWFWQPISKCWTKQVSYNNIKFAEELCGMKLNCSYNHACYNFLGGKTEIELVDNQIGIGFIHRLSTLYVINVNGDGRLNGFTFDNYKTAPWRKYENSIRRIIFTNITVIGKRAFYKLPNLEEITIPSTVSLIESRAFSDCPKLNKINFSQSPLFIEEKAFDNCDLLNKDTFSSSLIQYNNTTDKKLLTYADVIVLINSRHHSCHGIIENVIVEIPIVDRKGCVNHYKCTAGFCAECGTYFIYKADFNQVKSYGVILCMVSDENKKSKINTNNPYANLSEESFLKHAGYSVSKTDNLSDEQRQTILSCLIESNPELLHKIRSHLNWLIDRNCNNDRFDDAIELWIRDDKFIANYKLGSNPMVVKALSLNVR